MSVNESPLGVIKSPALGALAVALFCAAAPAAGSPGPDAALQSEASPPDLSGTWVLDVDASDFGPMPRYDRMVDVIEHDEPDLSIERSISTVAGGTVIAYALTTDGVEHDAEVSGDPARVSAVWDGVVLEMTVIVSTFDGPVIAFDRLQLSEDRDTLTIARRLQPPDQDPVEQSLVLRRR